MLAFALLAALWATCSSTLGQSNSEREIVKRLEPLKNEFLAAYSKGTLDEAHKLVMQYAGEIARALGKDNAEWGRVENYIAAIYKRRAEFLEAEKHYLASIDTLTRNLGPENVEVAEAHYLLALHYEFWAKYVSTSQMRWQLRRLAVDHMERSYVVRRKKLGERDGTTVNTMLRLGMMYEKVERYYDAEALLRTVMRIAPELHGPKSGIMIDVYHAISVVYLELGSFEQSLGFVDRAIAIWRDVNTDSDAPAVGLMNTRAIVLAELTRHEEAAGEFEKIVSFLQEERSDRTSLLSTRYSLALIYRKLKKHKEAEALLRQVLADRVVVFTDQHPETIETRIVLGRLLQDMNKLEEAEEQFNKILSVAETSLPANRLDEVRILQSLAEIHVERTKWEKAHSYFEKSQAILLSQMRRDRYRFARRLGGQVPAQVDLNRADFVEQMLVSHTLSRQLKGRRVELMNASFKLAQIAYQSETSAALAQMTARFASGDLGPVLRQRQELIAKWQEIDRKVVDASLGAGSKSARVTLKKLEGDLLAVESKLERVEAALERQSARYSGLTNPEPVSISEVQSILAPGEAMVAFVFGADDGLAWVITRQQAHWTRLLYGETFVRAMVAGLRCGLDGHAWLDPAKSDDCRKILATRKVDYSQHHFQRGEPLPFVIGAAYDLYSQIFAPIEKYIEKKSLLIFAPGTLTSLPLNVLLTKWPEKQTVASQDEYRDLAWLGTRQPITMLPSVTSLRVLRSKTTSPRRASTRPFVGFGNPLLKGPSEPPTQRKAAKRVYDEALKKQKCHRLRPPDRRSTVAWLNTLKTLPAVSFFFRGELANLDQVQTMWALPETSDELCAVAEYLSVSDRNVYLGDRATESRIKSLSERGELAKFNILHFATHGLISGDFKGLAEPALVLTPPREATHKDDGLLTASEVAKLKLNADWVVLSACNTASGDIFQADAFSGLARAFFFAGARSLLVSHWAVNSKATVKLVTGTFRAVADDPDVGRAEALRQSLVALINDRDEASNAHPAIWAPFVVVGDGR